MKRIITITAAILLSLTALGAQTIQEDIYRRYSDAPGVSAVYISPAMFGMINKIPSISIEDSEKDISGIVTSLEGMYILDIEDPVLAGRLEAEVNSYISKGRYQLLMEAKDSGDATRMYISLKDQDTIGEFVLISSGKGDNPSTAYISFVGNIPRDEFVRTIAEE